VAKLLMVSTISVNEGFLIAQNADMINETAHFADCIVADRVQQRAHSARNYLVTAPGSELPSDTFAVCLQHDSHDAAASSSSLTLRFPTNHCSVGMS
jgi:hypothetical protein